MAYSIFDVVKDTLSGTVKKTSSELSKAKIQPYKIKAMKINGAPNNNGIINGKYFFSESFCQTNGLDPQVYAQVDQGARLAGLQT